MKKGISLLLTLSFLLTGIAAAQTPDLREVRFGTYENYTRIVFDLSDAVAPEFNELREKKQYEVSFAGMTVSFASSVVEISDGVVSRVEISGAGGNVKAIIHVEAEEFTFKATILTGPDRVVIDVLATTEEQVDDAERYFITGVEFFERKEYDRAVQQFRLAIGEKPGYADAYYFAGLVRLERKQYDMAAYNLRRALEEEEKWGEAHLHLADIFLIQKDTLAAIVELSRYVISGKDEQKVIAAEERLSDLTGMPSIETPAEKPADSDENGIFTSQRFWLYIIIIVLSLFIGVLSFYVIRSDRRYKEQLRIAEVAAQAEKDAEKQEEDDRPFQNSGDGTVPEAAVPDEAPAVIEPPSVADLESEIAEETVKESEQEIGVQEEQKEELNAEQSEELKEEVKEEHAEKDVLEAVEEIMESEPEETPESEDVAEAVEEPATDSDMPDEPEAVTAEDDLFDGLGLPEPHEATVIKEAEKTEAAGEEVGIVEEAGEESESSTPDEEPQPILVTEESSPAEEESEPDDTMRHRRWLHTDHDTMAEVDDLSGKYDRLSKQEKDIEERLAGVLSKIKGEGN